MEDDNNLVKAELVEDDGEEETGLVKATNESVVSSDSNLIEKRDALVKQYHKNCSSIYEKIKNNPNGDSIDGVMGVIIEELLQETENLLGNALYLTDKGSIHDATTISVKRSDILETLSKVIVRKKDLSTRNNEVDLNSPVFQLFQQICFEKITKVLEELKMDNEMRQLIVMKWSDEMIEWDKELKSRMESLK